MSELDHSIQAILSQLEEYASANLCTLDVRSKDDIEQGDDYCVDWEVIATPLNKEACPVTLYISNDRNLLRYGMHLERVEDFVSRKQLKCWCKPLVVAGHEPIEIELETLLKRMERIVQGKVHLEYKTLFGVITSIDTKIGKETLYSPLGSFLGKRMSYTYAKW